MKCNFTRKTALFESPTGGLRATYYLHLKGSLESA